MLTKDVQAVADLNSMLNIGRKALLIAAGLTMLYAIVEWKRNMPPPANSFTARKQNSQKKLNPDGSFFYRYAFTPAFLISLAVLCFVQNGLLSSTFLYYLRFYVQPELATAVLGALTLAAGFYIDRYGVKTVKTLVLLCVSIFTLLPVIMVVTKEGAIYAFLHPTAYVTVHIFIFTLTLLLGRGPFEGRFSGLMCAAIYLIRGLAFVTLPLTDNTANAEYLLIAALMLGIIMTIVVYVGLRESIPDQAQDTPRMSLEEFQAHYKLTSRKQQVLQLLVAGADTHTVAKQLKITEYTVRLHIHQILRKAEVKNRKELLKMVENKD